ncbi:MAG: TIGR00153 family protein [Thiohalomonadales bacterium]
MNRTTISSLFGSSPLKPLQTHMTSVLNCVNELSKFIDAVLVEDWPTAKKSHKKIADYEKEADKLKKALRLRLPNSLFMPVSRRDILEVLTMQDKLANKTKDIAGLIIGRKIIFPASVGEQFKKFVARSIDASAQAAKAINELDELVETGFSGKEVKLVKSMIEELDRIESDTDKIQVKIRAEIFVKETQMPPIEVIFLYKVLDWTGDLADIAQRVGSRLHLMLAR